jgi:hypothetical protein
MLEENCYKYFQSSLLDVVVKIRDNNSYSNVKFWSCRDMRIRFYRLTIISFN